MNHPPIATAIPNVGRLPLGHFALTHHKSCSGMSGGTWRRALVSTSPTNSPRSQLDQASVGPAGSSLIYGGSCSHPTGSATNVLCPSLNRSEPSPINCGATMDQNPNPSDDWLELHLVEFGGPVDGFSSLSRSMCRAWAGTWWVSVHCPTWTTGAIGLYH